MSSWLEHGKLSICLLVQKIYNLSHFFCTASDKNLAEIWEQVLFESGYFFLLLYIHCTCTCKCSLTIPTCTCVHVYRYIHVYVSCCFCENWMWTIHVCLLVLGPLPISTHTLSIFITAQYSHQNYRMGYVPTTSHYVLGVVTSLWHHSKNTQWLWYTCSCNVVQDYAIGEYLLLW